jgi:ABC-type antimicrobial peptide transport system permease subunit
VRTSTDPVSLVNAVRKEIVAFDPTLPISGTDPLPTLMRESITEQRVLAKLSIGFGVMALLLAAIGLYGVMTYAVTRRTGEIGLRVALGAQSDEIRRMIVLDALRVVAVGAAAGVPLAFLATRSLGSQLHGVSATDPLSIGVALVVLAGTAVVASLIPAMRASRVAPILALQQE